MWASDLLPHQIQNNIDNNKLEIKLMIDNAVEFSKSSKAELYETGLIGGKAIAIIPNYKDSSIAESGDYLKGIIKPGLTELVNQKLTPLQFKLESAIQNADKVMLNIQRYGNTTNATMPLCLWEWENQLNKGDNIILAAFGGGFTWGSIYLKWAYDSNK